MIHIKVTIFFLITKAILQAKEKHEEKAYHARNPLSFGEYLSLFSLVSMNPTTTCVDVLK